MRRGVHAGMPLGTLPCPTPASLGENNLLFQKTLIFWEITQNLWARQQPRPRHAAKAMACCQGHGMLACSQGEGMQPRPRHAAKAKGCPPWHAAKAMACWHAAKAKACSQGQG